MHMTDYKRALYDFSAAISNLLKHEAKQPAGVKCDGLGSYYSKYICNDQTEFCLVYAGMCNYYLGQSKEAILHYDMAKIKHE